MAFRQMLKTVFKRTRPLMYATSTLFVDTTATEKPHPNQKLTLELPNVDNLSYDYMIKQSTIDAVNTTSRILTVTYSAIETTSKEYRNILSRLIVLVRETSSHEVYDSHWDMIVQVRAEVELKKQSIMQLVGFMDYVHKMAVATSEATYLAGMDNLSTTLCQRLDDAFVKIQEEINHNKELEAEYHHVQQQCIVKSTANEDVSKNQNDQPVSTVIPNTDLLDLVEPVSP